MRRLVLLVMAASMVGAGALAQTVERQTYVMSAKMHHDLDARQFDSHRIEQIVGGVAQALNTKSLGPILDMSAPEIRITDGNVNKVVKKQQLAAFKARLFADATLKSDVTDESQFTLKSDEVGLARGTIWIKEECLDDSCSQKKTSIITINIP